MIEDSRALSAQLDARAKLFELANDLLATFDRTGLFTDLNLAWERTLGWSREELIGKRALELVHPEDTERTFELYQSAAPTSEVIEFENRYRCKDGGYRWLQWNARRSGETWYAVARDVTDRRLLEEQAVRDPLTGLPNRTAMIERLAQGIRRLERHPGLVAILFIDLDHFKVINDQRGHKAGDRFLQAAASRLVDTVRGADAVARFGGDEFVVLIEDASRALDLSEVARRVVDALAKPIVVDGDEAVIGASVGIAVTSSTASSADALLHEADTAMYRAKARGGGCFELVLDGSPLDI